MNPKLAIVAIGYNRVNSISRLLDSLKRADYGSDHVTLIISIDNSGSSNVEDYANKFQWDYGEKIIKTYQQRQGLRKHILQCGNFLKDFDAIAVFEDDVLVAPGFYSFMKQAVKFYSNDHRIAGISLYSHMWNVNANYNFIPEPSSSDVFFLQFAQSWGQVWLKDQWIDFMKWYEKNSEGLQPSDDIPSYVTAWPESSWLKYHIKYCIVKNKYFVYPYNSLTTCFADVGEHNRFKNTLFQVPISNNVQKNFKFDELGNNSICYDAFFERQNIGSWLGIPNEELCVDIYGTKSVPSNKKIIAYMASIQNLEFRVLNSFALDMKPHEMNLLHRIEGKAIHLYDLTSPQTTNNLKTDEIGRFMYYQKLDKSKPMVLKVAKEIFLEKVKAKIKRTKKRKGL
ncbi:glycosyltransferase family 2 protein [Priestia aryabhattai]|uniref:glycosyltransferase family A protein n=1 Tax=Priestia aryabhattai TaxID=412384 RepID=UPI001C8E9962|nr:glycosyltransferase family A protein [Priestia aryabhattai]MBX9969234.1 glycosyltransferase family 2 protein [Priestia aryabhattai]